MPIIFDEHTSRLGGKHLMSDEPFAVIREGGEIYLSGDYTIEELLIQRTADGATGVCQCDTGYPIATHPICGICGLPRR